MLKLSYGFVISFIYYIFASSKQKQMDKYFLTTLNALGLGVGMAFFVLPTVKTNFDRVFEDVIKVTSIEDLIESESAIKATVAMADAQPITIKYHLNTTPFHSYKRYVVKKVEILD